MLLILQPPQKKCKMKMEDFKWKRIPSQQTTCIFSSLNEGGLGHIWPSVNVNGSFIIFLFIKHKFIFSKTKLITFWGRMNLYLPADTLTSFLKTGSYLTQVKIGVYETVYLTDFTSYYWGKIIFIQLAFGNFVFLQTTGACCFREFDQI